MVRSDTSCERWAASGPLLDPFAFPAETRGRFLMLATAALILTYSLASYVIYVPNLYTQVGSITPEVAEIQDRILEHGLQTLTYDDLQVFGDSPVAAMYARLFSYQVLRVGIAMLLTAAVVVGAALLYLLHPYLLRRRHASRPLTEQDAPTVLRDLRRFAAAAGLSPGVRFELKPGMLDGVAFGLRRREVLLLHGLEGDPRSLESTWNPFDKAVALHEIAHVTNDDIRNREIARALWIALSAIVVLLSAAVVLASLVTGRLQVPIFYDTEFLASPGPISSPQELGSLLVKTGALFLVIFWIWAQLIRARELYADLRVASWGMGEPLLQLLTLPESIVASRRRSFWKALIPPKWRKAVRAIERHAWRFHPSNSERMAILRDPLRLFKVSPGLSFLTGVLLTILFGNMTPLWTDLTAVTALVVQTLFFFIGPASLLIGLAAFLAVLSGLTYLTTRALGVQVQREAVADLATRGHSDWGYLRLVKPAFLFALGVEVGLLVTPLSSITAFKASLALPLWLAGFTCLTWIWLVYLRAMVRLVSGSRPGSSVPVGLQRFLTVASTVLLSVLFWPALMARGAIHLAERQGLLAAMMPPGEDPQYRFAYIFVMSSLFFLAIALVFYLVVAGISVAAAGIRLAVHRIRCPVCGEPSPYKLAVGRRCDACESELAPWIHLRPTVLVGGEP